MKKTKTNLLFAEFINASGYQERILQAIVHYSSLSSDVNVLNLCVRMHGDLFILLTDNILSKNLHLTEENQNPSPKETLHHFQSSMKLVEYLLKMNLHTEYLIKTVTKLINLIYQYAQLLHEEILKKTNLTIDYPRVNLTQMKEPTQKRAVPLFFLDDQSLQIDEFQTPVFSLDFRRIDRCTELIKDGHQKIFEKKYPEALELFLKAANYNATAEVLTLIGWSYSLTGNIPKAREYCLKAIKIDPDFGPPYNDMGNYLLTENRLDESLKWFDLAKKCRNYQHREYPFINAGKAYINKKEFEKALMEFEKALTFTPYNKELTETINRLKSSLKHTTNSVTFLEDAPLQ